MKQGQVIDLTTDISIKAAKLSLDHKIPVADSIILATGRLYQATIYTQDIDFKRLSLLKGGVVRSPHSKQLFSEANTERRLKECLRNLELFLSY